MVPFPAGGPVDRLTRAIGQELGERWKQGVVVDNRPGGTEAIAAQMVSTAAPDGYTILVAGRESMQSSSVRKLAHDPEKDFAPVTQLVTFNMALVVPAPMPVATFDEFVAYAKSKPRMLVFATSGIGGASHDAWHDLVAETGIDMTLVPYAGVTPIINEMLGGRVDAAFGALSALQPHIAGGKLKALAIGGAQRAKSLPNVPTFDELGRGSIDATFYAGLAVPAKTPAQVVEKLARDVRDVMANPAFVAKNIDPFALAVSAHGPHAFSVFLAEDRKRHAERIKRSGRKAD